MNRPDNKTGRIGVPFQDRPSVFELNIDEHVGRIDPADYGRTGPVFDANRYFITSGDATSKAVVLIRDLKRLLDANQGDGPYREAIAYNLDRARRLLELLLEARGPDVFLESEWDDRRLWVIPKNPRSKTPPIQEIEII